MSGLEVIARRKQRIEAIASGLERARQTVFPVQRHLHVLSRGEVVEIQLLDRSGQEFRVVGEGNEGVETGIVQGPAKTDGAKAPFGEDRLFGSISEIVEDGHGRSFLV